MRYGKRQGSRVVAGAAAVAAVVALAGCGHPAAMARPAPHATVPSPPARTTSAAHVPQRSHAPVGVAGGGERLAIALPGRGMLMWTAAHGTVVLERTGPRVDWFSNPTWSADGRYLAWFEGPGGSEPTMGLVRYDTVLGTSTAWTLSTDFLADPMVVTGAGVTLLDANTPARTAIREYVPGGLTNERAVTGPAAEEWTSFGTGVEAMAATSAGFVVAGRHAARPGQLQLFTIGLNGSSRAAANVRLPGAGIQGFAVSPLGSTAAIVVPETIGATPLSNCAQRSPVETVDLRTGATTVVPLPPARPGVVGRVQAMGYGPSGVLDIVELPCLTARSGAIAPVFVGELRGSAFHAVAGGALQAERSVSGALAVIPATYFVTTSGRMAWPFPAGAQSGPVTVDGRPIPLTARTPDVDPQIAWAPAG